MTNSRVAEISGRSALVLLRLPKVCVHAIYFLHELVVGSGLDDGATIEHQDLVRVHDGGQAVRHTDRRPPGGQVTECRHYALKSNTCRQPVRPRVATG